MEVVENFEIQTITATTTSLRKYFIDSLEKEQWFPARDDIKCYLACDPISLRVGMLNGKPIAIVAVFVYDDQWAHAGCFLVDKAYRARGFGWKMTTDLFRERVQPNMVLSGYSVNEMLEKYQENLKGVVRWRVERHLVDIAKAVSTLNYYTSNTTKFNVKQVHEVDRKGIYVYDSKVFGYKRENFVKQLLDVSHARVAVNHDQEIVGYAAARVLYNPGIAGYKVGPVFCDSLEIARCLLKAVFEDVLVCGESSKKVVVIDFPLVVNAASHELPKLLEGEILATFPFLSRNGLPKFDLKKWFAVTAVETG